MNIPNFIDTPFVDVETGNLTDTWREIMQQLFSELQNNASNEGTVVPTQSTANITTIQNNQVATPTGNQYTCQFGTFIYDSNTGQVKVALNNAGVPTFHIVVTL